MPALFVPHQMFRVRKGAHTSPVNIPWKVEICGWLWLQGPFRTAAAPLMEAVGEEEGEEEEEAHPQPETRNPEFWSLNPKP